MRAGDLTAGRRPAGAWVPHRRRREGEPRDRRGAARRLGRGRLRRQGRRRPGPGRGRGRGRGLWGHPGPRHRGELVAFPTPSPDGTKLAWINWDHPQDALGRHRAAGRLGDGDNGGGRVADSALIMGGPQESVLAPRWRNDESLYDIRTRPAGGTCTRWPPWPGPRTAAAPAKEEFAGPLWELERAAVRAAVRRKARRTARPGRAADGGPRPRHRDAGRHSPAQLPDRPHRTRRLGHHDRQHRHGPTTPWAVLRVFPAAAGAGDSCFEIMSEQPGRRARPRLPAGRAAGAAVGRGGRTRSYTPWSTQQSARGGAGRRTATVRRVHPRRPDLQRAARREPGEGVLHQPGHRGHRRELRRLDQRRPGLPGTAARPVGHRRRGRRDAGAGAGRRRRDGPGWARAREQLDGARLGHHRPRAHRALQEAVFAAATSYYGVSDLRPFASTPTTSSPGTSTA